MNPSSDPTPPGGTVYEKSRNVLEPTEKIRFLWKARSILSSAYESGIKRSDDPNVFGAFDLEFELELLDVAYDLAEEFHAGKKRRNGDDEFTHPLGIAKILLEDFPNPTTFKVIVGLLHDVIEDTEGDAAKTAMRKRLLDRLRSVAMKRERTLVSEHGIAEGMRRLDGLLRFCNEIVEGVELLSKKEGESFLTAWERPIYEMHKNLDGAYDWVPRNFFWSPAVRPSTVWKETLKSRVEDEYHRIILSLLDDRLLVALIDVKLADRSHNLLTMYDDDSARIERYVLETEEKYIPIARRIHEDIVWLLSSEIAGLKTELIRRKTGEGAF